MACDECNCYFSFWSLFFPFTPLTAGKRKISKKWKKRLQISLFYTSVIKLMIIWYWSVPEIWHVTDVIVISHFGLFFALLTPPPPNSQKNENFTKMKKYPGDIIILHKCTKTHDNMMCCSWDMVRGRCNYFSFWATFCPFTPLTAQKIKISLKWKKVLEISSFYASVPKIMIICYIVLEIWHMMYVIVVFHLGNFLHFYPLTAQK